MKIRVIDLLNKIANDEKIPEYIRYFNIKDKHDLVMLVCKENLIYRLNENAIDLNDEVEIIESETSSKDDNFTGWKVYQDGVVVFSMDTSEEPKKIEKLSMSRFANKQKKLARKINEVIDKINEMEK